MYKQPRNRDKQVVLKFGNLLQTVDSCLLGRRKVHSNGGKVTFWHSDIACSLAIYGEADFIKLVQGEKRPNVAQK